MSKFPPNVKQVGRWLFYRLRWTEAGRQRERLVRLCRAGAGRREVYAAIGRLKDDIPYDGTFTELVETYREKAPQYARLAPGTLRTYDPLLDRLVSVFGKMRPNDIRQSDVRRLCKIELPGAQGNRIKAVMSGVLEFACDAGICEENVARGIRGNPETGEVYVPQPAELAEDIEAAPDWLRPILQFAALTGMRRGDICALRREDLRDDGIYYTTRKRKRQEIIPWTDALRGVVRDALTRQGNTPALHVFVNAKRRPMDSESQRNYLTRAIRVLQSHKRQRWTLHGLRHYNKTHGGEGATLPRYQHRRVVRSLR